MARGTRRLAAAKLIDRLQPVDADRAARITAVPRNGPLPCSFAQERIWRLASRPGGGASYTMVSVAALRGRIDLEAVRVALQQVVASHEPLRTTFAERDGTPVQIVHPPRPLDIPFRDLTGEPDPETRATELLQDDASSPFRLERGPLVRFQLVRLAEHEFRLLRVTHHIVTDRQSWDIFFTEFVEAYDRIRRGRALPAPQRLQYGDFAVWERFRLDPAGPHYRAQLAWWRHELDGVSTLQLPFARPTSATGLAPEAGNIRWGIDPGATDSLDRLARAEGVTRYTVRLAVFSALLALEADRDEVAIGTYVDNRRQTETRRMFGYFVNLITLVLPFDPAAPLRRWLGKVRLLLTEARARGEIPYERVLDDLRAAGSDPPEITAIFGVRRAPPELPFVELEWLPATLALLTMPWGFTFTLDQRRESDRCEVAFDANLHDPSAVRRFIDGYATLAEAAAARPDEPLGDLHAALR